MRRVWLVGLGCSLVGGFGCSPQPKCAYVECTQNVVQACSQLQALGETCGPSSSQATFDACQADLESACSESDSNGLANATGCFGSGTACAGAAKSIQACFQAQTLSSDCRSAAQGQIHVFLPDGG